MNDTPCIRAAMLGDAAAISTLISRLTRQAIVPHCSDEGARTLLASMTTAEVLSRLVGHTTGDQYRYHVAALSNDGINDAACSGAACVDAGNADARSAGAIVGVIAMRLPSHLYHLFVDDAWQGRGLARLLWNTASTALFASDVARPVTVNSAPDAVVVYQRLGFVVDGTQGSRAGIPSIPMRWLRDTGDTAAKLTNA